MKAMVSDDAASHKFYETTSYVDRGNRISAGIGLKRLVNNMYQYNYSNNIEVQYHSAFTSVHVLM